MWLTCVVMAAGIHMEIVQGIRKGDGSLSVEELLTVSGTGLMRVGLRVEVIDSLGWQVKHSLLSSLHLSRVDT